MISVIIPAADPEPYLERTVSDLLKKSTTSIEVIVVLDGWWPPTHRIITDPRIRYIHFGSRVGMRRAINAGAAISRGDYLLKSDAHCLFDAGFDQKLRDAHRPDWVQIPTRKRLDPESWQVICDGRPDINYMRLDADYRGRIDPEKNNDLELRAALIDDTEAFQGSCYFISKDFFARLGLLDDIHFAGSGHEAQEIGFSVLSAGGRIIRNKTTWYAHWHRDRGIIGVDREKSREYFRKFLAGVACAV